MDIKNLEYAAKLHTRRLLLLNAVADVDLLLDGNDTEGDPILPDNNNFDLYEDDSNIEITLAGLNIGHDVLNAIKDVLIDNQEKLFKDVKEL